MGWRVTFPGRAADLFTQVGPFRLIPLDEAPRRTAGSFFSLSSVCGRADFSR